MKDEYTQHTAMHLDLFLSSACQMLHEKSFEAVEVPFEHGPHLEHQDLLKAHDLSQSDPMIIEGNDTGTFHIASSKKFLTAVDYARLALDLSWPTFESYKLSVTNWYSIFRVGGLSFCSCPRGIKSKVCKQ